MTRNFFPRLLPWLLLAGWTASCSITRAVRPVPAVHMDRLYVEDDFGVMDASFLPEIQAQLQELGITTQSFTGSLPADGRFRLQSVAEWGGWLVRHLVYVDLRVLDSDQVIGRAVYDARAGGARLDKWSKDATTLARLLEPLFAQVNRAPSP